LIFLHIGLHKTATTSLQESVWPHLESCFFLGRRAASGEKELAFYEKFSRYCFSQVISDEEEQELKSDLKALELEYGNVLISDEWFTSKFSKYYGFEGASWQVKLEKLSRIFYDFHTVALLTLREPLSLAYSMYIEFLQVGYNGDFISFCTRTNDSEIFDFEYLLSYLDTRFNEIELFTFDEFVDGSFEKRFTEIFGASNVPKLSSKNKKVSNEYGIQIGIKYKFYDKFGSYIPRFIKVFLKRYFNFRISRIIVVPPLTDSEKKLFSSKFSSSIHFYDNLLSQRV